MPQYAEERRGAVASAACAQDDGRSVLEKQRSVDGHRRHVAVGIANEQHVRHGRIAFAVEDRNVVGVLIAALRRVTLAVVGSKLWYV